MQSSNTPEIAFANKWASIALQISWALPGTICMSIIHCFPSCRTPPLAPLKAAGSYPLLASLPAYSAMSSAENLPCFVSRRVQNSLESSLLHICQCCRLDNQDTINSLHHEPEHDCQCHANNNAARANEVRWPPKLS